MGGVLSDDLKSPIIAATKELEILDTLAGYQALKTRLRYIIQCSSHNRIVSVRCGFIELLATLMLYSVMSSAVRPPLA